MINGLNDFFGPKQKGDVFCRLPQIFLFLLILSVGACGDTADSQEISIPETILIPAGPFLAGSDAAEREYAYQLDEAAYAHSRTREHGWYDSERSKKTITLEGFEITKNLITNREYADFVADTGYPAPDIDSKTWAGYRLIHPYERTRRHAWQDGELPTGRENHPVVLVSYSDAAAYATWLSEKTGDTWRLPSELEWEKAARGVNGDIFPWGNEFNAGLLNSHDAGPFDTMPVGSFPKGTSLFGLMDPAGQVFEWTSTSPREGRYYVKGGSWDDRGCGICRPAARHTRPESLKHILVGFRLVRAVETNE